MRDRKHVHVLKWLSQVTGKKKAYIFFLVVQQILLGAMGVFSAILFRSLIDEAVAKDKAGFLHAVIWIAALMVGQLVTGSLGRFLYEWSRASLENQFKQRLFSCLLHKAYASVTAIHSGEWLNRLTSDAVVVANGITDIIPSLAGMLTRMSGALVAVFMLEPMFVYILVPGGGLILLLACGFRKVLKRLHKQMQEADGAVRIFMQERLENLMIVRTFAMEKETEKTAAGKMRIHKAARMRRNNLSNLCNVGFGLAANGIYLFGAAYCGYGILCGTVSYGTMTAVLQLVGQIQAPFVGLSGFLPRYYAMIASTERLMEAESYVEDCEKEPIGEQDILLFYQKEFKSIGLRNVAFTYQSRIQKDAFHAEEASMPMVLKDINLEIRKGEYVAFTGHSGCGKSTILKLLMSLYPLDSGERYIEGNSNPDTGTTRQPLTARWRGLFAYVPQGNQLMSGTIREIVAFGDAERMRQETLLMWALQVACADEFVYALKDGLDTVLGERGSGLSDGQMQRIAIARAVFSNHPILMLDEATSALDEVTEQRLLANLKAMTDKTLLIVTHRPAALRICDKQIIMTEEGINITIS